MPLLTSSAVVIRCDQWTTDRVHTFEFSEDVTNDELDTIILQPAGSGQESFAPSFLHAVTAHFLGISSTLQVEVSINGGVPVKLRSLLMDCAEITELSITNLSTTSCATIRLILGGGAGSGEGSTD